MEYLLKKNEEEKNKKPIKKLSFTGKCLIVVTGGIGLGITIVCSSFVAPAFRRYCLPYIPATSEQINNVISCIPKNIKNNSRLLDIGSGDGRIVIATAKHGIKSDGVELNPWLVWYSRIAAFRNNLRDTKFYKKNLWNFNISSYNYIVIFGVEHMLSIIFKQLKEMKDLEKKLLNETQLNTKIIACRFPLPNLRANKIINDGVNTVWLYEINNIKDRMEKPE